jgi:hypothetical protein
MPFCLQTGKSDDWEREAFDVIKYSKISFFSSVIGVAAVAALFRWGGGRAGTCFDGGQARQALCCAMRWCSKLCFATKTGRATGSALSLAWCRYHQQQL